MKKNKLIIILIVSLSLLIGTIVYADTFLYDADEVSYDNSSSTLTKTNVQEALDELYNKCKTKPTTCPSNKNCTAKPTPICKRASTLHTETCQQNSTSYYCGAVEGYNNTITYGQIGTSGVLTPGDAFDCDVNGDGTYDSDTERFYYVSDYYDTSTKSFNGEVAVLIYYTNTINGEATTSGSAYATTADLQEIDSSLTTYDNWHGPVTAVKHLPSTESWSNISLYKTNRQILTQTNTTSTSGGSLPNYSYSGKAARLLTYQEVYNGCYNTSTSITSPGGLNNCNFLMENTIYSKSGNETYGPWLETPFASNPSIAYQVYSYYRNVYGLAVNYTIYGVRPSIEILKSKISY